MSCLHNFQKIQPDHINIIVDGIPIFTHFCFNMRWNAQFGCSDISVDLKCTIYIFTKNLYKHFKLDLFYQYIFIVTFYNYISGECRLKFFRSIMLENPLHQTQP